MTRIAQPRSPSASLSKIQRRSASCFLSQYSSYLPHSHQHGSVNNGISNWEGSHLKEKHIFRFADKRVTILDGLNRSSFHTFLSPGSWSVLSHTHWLRRIKVYIALMTQNMLQKSLEFPRTSSILKANFLVSTSPARRGAVKLEASPAVLGRRQGFILGKFLVYRAATQKGKQPLSLKPRLLLVQGDAVGQSYAEATCSPPKHPDCISGWGVLDLLFNIWSSEIVVWLVYCRTSRKLRNPTTEKHVQIPLVARLWIAEQCVSSMQKLPMVNDVIWSDGEASTGLCTHQPI